MFTCSFFSFTRLLCVGFVPLQRPPPFTFRSRGLAWWRLLFAVRPSRVVSCRAVSCRAVRCGAVDYSVLSFLFRLTSLRAHSPGPTLMKSKANPSPHLTDRPIGLQGAGQKQAGLGGVGPCYSPPPKYVYIYLHYPLPSPSACVCVPPPLLLYIYLHYPLPSPSACVCVPPPLLHSTHPAPRRPKHPTNKMQRSMAPCLPCLSVCSRSPSLLVIAIEVKVVSPGLGHHRPLRLRQRRVRVHRERLL